MHLVSEDTPKKITQTKLQESDFNSATHLGLKEEPRWSWQDLWYQHYIRGGFEDERVWMVNLGLRSPRNVSPPCPACVCISAMTRLCLFYLSGCILLIFLRILKLVIDSAFSVKKEMKWKKINIGIWHHLLFGILGLFFTSPEWNNFHF